MAWHDDRIALVELLDWLDETGHLSTPRDAIHVVEKPSHYDDAYREMLAAREAEDTAERLLDARREAA